MTDAAAGQRCGEVRENVGMQVGRHHRVDRPRAQHHAHGHRVDQLLVPGHVREVGGHFGGDLVPHHQAEFLRVRLGDDGEVLARPLAGAVEGEAHDPLDAAAGEDRHLGRHFLRQTPMGSAALARVLALGVLSHADHVDVGGAQPGSEAVQGVLDAFAEGIRFLRRAKWNERQRAWAREHFLREVKPVLTPIGLDPAHRAMTVRVERQTPLRDVRGARFPTDRAVVDPEGIRHLANGHILWSSEGTWSEDPALRVQPAIYESNAAGRVLRQYHLPSAYLYADNRTRGAASTRTTPAPRLFSSSGSPSRTNSAE